MYYLLAMITIIVLGTIAIGFYLTLEPVRTESPRRIRQSVFANIAMFCLAFAGLVVMGVQDVMAQMEAAGGLKEVSTGMGLAIIGIGLPTAGSALAAGIAVGPVASAALAVIVEKPEMFGRSLVFLGLAEGIAIYGLVVSILLLNLVQ